MATTSTIPTPSSGWCSQLILPSGGVLYLDNNVTTAFTAAATFKLSCDNPNPIISPDTTGNSTVIGFQDPFYASIAPEIYVLAACTVVSYILVILIFITPRTFFVGGPGGGAGFLARRRVMTGSYGSSSIIGVGRRPLLQKIATLTVAVSLSIATADTFSETQAQYELGYMDSSSLVDSVVDSLEVRVVRVISDTFLWLAQVQTLIRLFPRHKEKVTIKWMGFALVSLDTIFSILNSFLNTTSGTRPQTFQDAIPALNYLFELAISLMYASCVIYYSLSKRRYAFWHPKMRNVCLVAIISLVSVVVPVVFFVVDLASPNLAGWGQYVQWVGANAASVVVWEWVERIEALERDDKKDGILGREIFDGDEMLNMTPTEEVEWPGRGNGGGPDLSNDHSKSPGVGARYRQLRNRFVAKTLNRSRPPDGEDVRPEAITSSSTAPAPPQNHITAPQPVLTPPSRTDTASAASTVYAVRYHNIGSPSPALSENQLQPDPISEETEPKDVADSTTSDSAGLAGEKELEEQENNDKAMGISMFSSATKQALQAMPNPFKRRKIDPPTQVADAQTANGSRRSPIDLGLNLRARLGAFASGPRERTNRQGSVPLTGMPITVIPAPRSNGLSWAPEGITGPPQNFPVVPPQEAATSLPAESQPQQSEDRNVVVIPAPTGGRTWSPGDLDQR